ncbi:MAG: DUF1572 family protein [Gemmatimonadota bacterium]
MSEIGARDAGSTEQAFIARSRAYLSGEYLPKIRASVERMSAEDLWWRPNDASNSVGNLVLHLAGNIRQWIAHGVGRQPDMRDRPAEFYAEGGIEADSLLALLEDALGVCDDVLAGLDPASLHERRTIQGLDVSVLEAVYHAVEHFAGHTYQIMYVAKARTGRDLGFWKVEGGKATPAW